MTLIADSALSGEFVLVYPSLGFTEPLSHDASSALVASAIRALGSEQGEAVTVSRDRTGARGYTWRITFDDLSIGDRPQLFAIAAPSLETRDRSAFLLSVDTITDGVATIGGMFEMAYSPEAYGPGEAFTGPISHDASAREFEAALEALPDVGDISVDVKLLNGGDDGRVFTVSWPIERGNVPILRVNGSGLTPSADDVGVSGAPVAYVIEVSLRDPIFFILKMRPMAVAVQICLTLLQTNIVFTLYPVQK